MNRLFSLIILGCSFLSAFSQEDAEMAKLVDDNVKTDSKEKVTATFKTTRLINLTTNEQVKKGELDFRIAHRFDDMAGTGKGVSNFFGFDAVSDIRFSFDYGLSDRWQIGLGRSKGAYAQSQVFDLNSKFKLMEQRKGGFPMGISLHGGTTITSMESNGSSSSVGNFNKFPHRVNYFGQIVFVKKFSPGFSFVLAPTVVHRNLVNLNDNNTSYAIAAGLRLKLSKRSAIIADYYQVLNVSAFQKSSGFQMPIGLGYELETGGHVFHVLLSNNRGIMESQFLTQNTEQISKGQIRLGFNISRVFTILKDKE